MTDTEWLASLKPGDEVILETGWVHTQMRFEKVLMRTPSGRIRAGGLEFNPDGSRRGQSSYNRTVLRQPTPELRAKILRESMLSRLNREVWGQLPDAVLSEVCAVLDRSKPCS